MEIVSVKFQEEVLEKIDSSIAKNNFNSRTEFIREAVRDKLNELNREELIQEFLKFRGKGNKTNPEENRNARETAGKELIQELERRFR